MRYIQSLALAVALQVPAIVSAQQISVGGWVNRVDTANSTITIRTLANPRTVQVAPNAVIRVNGVISRLDQIPANSAITLTTEKGPTGVLTATQITVNSSGPQPSAAAPAGSTVQGTLVGVNIPDNAVTVRTVSGDHVVPLGTAPIMINGARGSIRNFRVGQNILIQRSLPTEASTDFVTQMVRVTAPANQVAAQPAVVRTRTRSYRSSYRSRRATTHKQTRKGRRRTASRRQAAQDRFGVRAAEALAGTAPATAVVTTGAGTVMTAPPPAATGAVTVAPRVVIGAPGAVTAAPTAVAPGTVYVAPADVAVPPVTAVPTAPVTAAPTGVIGVGPATIAPDPRLQSGAAAPGTPDARTQAGASAGSAAIGVGDPRLQSVAPGAAVVPGTVPLPGGAVAPGTVPVPGAAVVPGAAPAPGVPDPRFQSFGPNAVPGVTVPAAPGVIPTPVAPGGFGRPGFIGPRVLAPRPMLAPRVVAPPAAPR